jgi:hypothetical protein
VHGSVLATTCHETSEQGGSQSRILAAVMLAFVRLYHMYVHKEFKKSGRIDVSFS